MSQQEPALLAVAQGIARVVLNRPEQLNAFDFPSGECLNRLFERIERDPAVRAVTITGAGRAFMAGGDLAEFQRNLADAPLTANRLIELYHRLIRTIRRLAPPVIAGVNGVAAGGGLGLAMACDMIVAASDARFVPAYTALGTNPDGGTTWSITRLIGARRAMEWIMLGDPMGAEQALSLGLVNRVVPPESLSSEVDALARRIAQGPAGAYASVKRLVWQAEHAAFIEQLEAERAGFVAAAGTSDFREGVAAFFERRPARFP